MRIRKKYTEIKKMLKHMNKVVVYMLASSLLAFFFIFLYLYLPTSYLSLNERLRDFMFIERGQMSSSEHVVIVDIDEKSLNLLGQWPWSRDQIALILQNLSRAGAGIIGLDILFSEKDRLSPLLLAKEYDLHLSGLDDFDAILAETIANTPTIIGYRFKFSEKFEYSEMPMLPAIFIEKNLPEMEFLPVPNAVTTNIPVIQQNAYSAGFFNNIPTNPE